MRTKNSLTQNEKKVLNLLLDNAKINDSEISQKIKISPQAIRKIRLKLEKSYIKQYRTIIDYNKIGIKIFIICQLNIKDNNLLNNKNIIGAFEINESNISHYLIMGFSSVEELDNFKKKIKNKADIFKIDVFSKNSMLKNSPNELIKTKLKNTPNGVKNI